MTVVERHHDAADPFDDGRNLEGRVGGDLKLGLGPNFTLEATVNPDFGQTDVDRQVVNLTRFSVFFPERRQFFLENRGVFFTGNGSRLEPFFSRRIGLDEAGEPIPIYAGARLTTRSADHATGVLAVSQGRLICLSTPDGGRGFFFDGWARIEFPADKIPRIKPETIEEDQRALLDMAKLAGPALERWYDPSPGTYTAVNSHHDRPACRFAAAVD